MTQLSTSVDVTRRVYLLGRLQIEEQGEAIQIPRGKAAGLFVYLLLQPEQSHRREALAEMVAEGLAPARRRQQLSDLIYRLRKALGPHWIETDRERISLNQHGLWTDLGAFEDYSQQNDLAKAVSLYAGDLTPDLEFTWLLPQRVLLRERYVTHLYQLANSLEAEQQYAAALDYYRQMAATEPLREDAQRGMMRCLAALRRIDEAINSYERFEQQMSDLFDMRPTVETMALVRRLREERSGSAVTARLLTRVPFVGRIEERAALLSALDRGMAGEGGAVIVLGQPGIGKSRLLELVQESAGWRGWQVHYARCDEFAVPEPFAPLPAALTTALPAPRRQQMVQLVPAHWLDLVSRIVPTIKPQFARAATRQERVNPRQMSTAILRLLSGLAEIAPHLIVLDDIQWADPGFWQLMTDLIPQIGEMPIVFMLSGRDQDLRFDPVTDEALRSWEQSGAQVLSLGPLKEEFLNRLVQLASQVTPDEAELQRLKERSGGNPLFALTMLASGSDLKGSVGSALVELIQLRLDRLPAPNLLALQAAAVLGYQFDYDEWRELAVNVAPEELPIVAGELERHRLLQISGDSYRFMHDTLRAHVYAGIPDDRRQRLHQAALSLRRQQDEAFNLSWLHHARGANDAAAIAHYANLAGQAALEAFAFSSAREHFSLALAYAAPDETKVRYEATLGRVQALDYLGERHEHGVDSQALLDLARAFTGQREQAEANYFRAEWLWKVGELDEALAFSHKSLAAAEAAEASDIATDALLMLARIARNRGEFNQAQTILTRASERYRQIGNRFGEASVLDKGANLLFEQGNYVAASSQHGDASAIFAELGYTRQQVRAASGMAKALRAQGDYDQARHIHEKNVALSIELEDWESTWVEQVILGNIAFELGDFAQSQHWYKQGLILARRLRDPFAESLILYNLGDTYRQMKAFAEAQESYDLAEQICAARGFQRGQANILHSQGMLALAQNKPKKALSFLQEAEQIWLELNQSLRLLETEAALAMCLVHLDDIGGARERISAALQSLDEQQEHTDRWRFTHYAAYLVALKSSDAAQAREHLIQAARSLISMADRRSDEDRRRLLEQVPLHHEILQAAQSYADVRPVLLVDKHVPLGRTLTDDDYVQVRWTRAALLDELIAGKRARRQVVVRRLLREAAEQGGSPTDQDLAKFLGVAVRTIERDLAALLQLGVSVETRRRS